MKKNILIIGPPGAGKGTLAQFISNYYSIPHISTGDIFRTNIKNKTILGQKALIYIDNAQLVPDIITNIMVEQRLQNIDCVDGFVLDGYPRSITQANTLKKILLKKGQKVNLVLYIKVASKVIYKRILGRIICCVCHQIYHLVNNPPITKNVCNYCGGNLHQRNDDTLVKVQTRFTDFNIQTQPLFNYYYQKDNLQTIDGNEDPHKTFKKAQVIIND